MSMWIPREAISHCKRAKRWSPRVELPRLKFRMTHLRVVRVYDREEVVCVYLGPEGRNAVSTSFADASALVNRLSVNSSRSCIHVPARPGSLFTPAGDNPSTGLEISFGCLNPPAQRRPKLEGIKSRSGLLIFRDQQNPKEKKKSHLAASSFADTATSFEF
ncbi:hypothetical protein B0H17DRAFT_1140000 [Mycena rosella]|uniref:Uncharacterized protein n=1 Tax=Mycena rosella TaxID=1033263 RepID=A0AAD7GCG2_MYCRO|nr:hypothetical protein B0H17DRAFT_1140000 [Mycena rosella]